MHPDTSPAVGETIGQRLKRLRLERGLSQRELAAPGVSYAYISRIEAGTRQPSVKALRRLAAKLGVTADYLETGSQLGADEQRELRLADLELAVRLSDGSDVEEPLLAILGYALSDLGELARAEEVVSAALSRLDDTDDPYMRVRLYWSMARLAHTEGRPSVALANIRKAIALLQATDDTLHLARAHILAATITLSREDADGAALHLDRAEQLLGM